MSNDKQWKPSFDCKLTTSIDYTDGKITQMETATRAIDERQIAPALVRIVERRGGSVKRVVTHFRFMNKPQNPTKIKMRWTTPADGGETVTLEGGTTLTPQQATEALHAARYLIQGIGCVPDSEDPQLAKKWLKRYFPGWA